MFLLMNLAEALIHSLVLCALALNVNKYEGEMRLL